MEQAYCSVDSLHKNRIKEVNLCVLIPAFNEEENLSSTIYHIYDTLTKATISHNILVVNDHSTDDSEILLKHLSSTIPTLRYLNNSYGRGFGNALRFGLDNWEGDIVTIMMADASDNPEDAVLYYSEIYNKDVDCVFGSRFIKGGSVLNYPRIKLFCNRAFNNMLRVLVNRKINDFTNAFKAYQRDVIDSCKPFTSENFSLTVEIPLKALQKGYTYSVVPISWTQRKYGYSKLNLIKNLPAYLKILRLYLIHKL